MAVYYNPFQVVMVLTSMAKNAILDFKPLGIFDKMDKIWMAWVEWSENGRLKWGGVFTR